ncbi:hypothetical protein [Sphingobium yanoikuyae]|uniref:Uncharacterized protein n=1 Tax=Sphingobium yanoikuyae TaxID=13690 RepID=A0A291N0B8_SPHYA|nr:hypothetical protein [Sphingobium yanoikuyae]ATI80789.1 hypothetical protein A6768_12865 [Sphingobium yanoikuyae]
MLLEKPQSLTLTASSVVRLQPIFSRLERLALTVGIMDGRTRRNRSRVEWLFVWLDKSGSISLANPRLEALRAYAELCRTQLSRICPTTGLEELGFTALQIEAARELVFADAARGEADN